MLRDFYMIISGSRKLAIYGWETTSRINYGDIGRRIRDGCTKVLAAMHKQSRDNSVFSNFDTTSLKS